jgi:hypothetical protein
VPLLYFENPPLSKRGIEGEFFLWCQEVTPDTTLKDRTMFCPYKNKKASRINPDAAIYFDVGQKTNVEH